MSLQKTRLKSSAWRARQVADALAALESRPQWQSARTVLLYHSLPDEVDTHDFIRRWSRSKRILLPVVRGNMRRIIVVQPPDPMFTQAMFILRDDYFQTPGLSSQELLRQAREAARDCVDQAMPAAPVRPVFPTAMSVFALGAAAAIFALWLGGVI